MNTQGEEVETLNECEYYFHIWCSIFKNLGKLIRTFVTNKYLRVRNWNQKHDLIHKSRDENICNFQEKSKKDAIVEKFNELIQPLKDEGMNSRIHEGSLAT